LRRGRELADSQGPWIGTLGETQVAD
jgi:hypothetical protein